MKKLWHKLKRLFSLQVRDYPLLLEAWLVLARVDLAIRFFPYERWRHWLESAEKHSVKQQKEFDIASLIALSEMVARHHICPMNCLRRSIAQKKMLARRGIVVSVHIGVKNDGGGFEAHSWLSYGGRVLNDSVDVTERYVELRRDQWKSAKLFQ
ncbi:MAG: lasso peptide biosynthesis B2 protein [Proteobacteria bacterium]|nr:lasso peptide biosynthesis B2 protein [Pseudomonadota bacterium]